MARFNVPISFKIDTVEVLNRLAYECSIDPVTLDYCRSRLKNEGLKFLTVTLPELSKAIIVSLEEGFFVRPTSFAWKGALLKHFPLLSEIFDNNGLVRDNSQICCIAIKQMRQFCEYFYKLSMDFSEEDLVKAENKFLSHERSVPSVGEYDVDFIDQLRKDFETYYPQISSASVHDILSANPPRSGSGTYSSVQSSEYGAKWFTRRIYDISSPEKWRDYAYSRRETRYSPCPMFKDECDRSQVLFVPKDSRGPRTIVREPFLSLGYQMAYFDFLSKSLERATRHRINFQDQTVNQKLAESSSISKGYSTLDLKDASDSTSGAVVDHIVRYSPGLRAFISRRTRVVILPSGKKIKLRKLSGMGSGLTFPTMALLIHLAIVRYIVNMTGFSYKLVSSHVYVYGDDIVVPTDWYDYAVEALSKASFQVNLKKSFRKGFFRESCGADYYYGQDVSFVRLKLSATRKKKFHRGILFLKSQEALHELDVHAAELMKHGINQVAEYYYQLIEKIVGRLPIKTGDVPFIARYSFVMPESYFTSPTLYEKIKCVQVVPRTYEVHDRETFFLSARLRDSKPATWEDLFSESCRDHHRISIPRKTRYKYSTVNPLTLT